MLLANETELLAWAMLRAANRTQVSRRRCPVLGLFGQRGCSCDL